MGRSITGSGFTGAVEAMADLVVGLTYDDLDAHVRTAATQTLVNYVGCALGGSDEASVDIAIATLLGVASAGTSQVIGRPSRLDPLNAALVNCLSSAVHTFDDTNLRSIAHIGGPVCSAALALAGETITTGPDLMVAIVVGFEIASRLGRMLTEPPAASHVGLFMTGLVGGVGAAVTAARLLRLGRSQLVAAIGISACQAGGLRAAHGTMTSALVCASGARTGLMSAMLARNGFSGASHAIEGPHGFADVFATDANRGALTQALGSRFEIMDNSIKPYPCGVVVHPVIDAILTLINDHAIKAEQVTRCLVHIGEVAASLGVHDRPRTALEAQVSVQHWVAAVLYDKAAGLAQAATERVNAPDVVELRERVVLETDATLGPSSAEVTVWTTSGHKHVCRVEHARGSFERPMSDGEIDLKMLAQSERILGARPAERLLSLCRNVASLPDVSRITAGCQPPQRRRRGARS